MKILILGGCADMAAPLIPLLTAENSVKSITLADINEEKALEKASADPKLKGVKLDAENRNELVSLMKEHDLALGYVGPFYYFEKKMGEAAIEAGCDYISICDDYDAYLSVITLDEKARAKGVKILTGFGNSPGLTQVLAKKGYLSMARPERININWTAGSDESVGATNLMHLFHIFTGTTLQFIDGMEIKVKTGTGKKYVDFPEPIGTNPVYYTGHAESVSIPRNLPGLKEVTLHGGVKPPYIVGLVKKMADLKLTKDHKRRRFLAKTFHRIEGIFGSQGVDKSVGRIDVYGYDKDDNPVYNYYMYVGHIAEITSLPCYTAAIWHIKGKWDKKPGGVYAPEKIIDNPDEFLNDLQSKGLSMTYCEQR